MRRTSSRDWIPMANRFGSPLLSRIVTATAGTSWALAVGVAAEWALSILGTVFAVSILVAIIDFYTRWEPEGSERWWSFTRPFAWSGFMLWVMIFPSSETDFPSSEREARFERGILIWSATAWASALIVGAVRLMLGA